MMGCIDIILRYSFHCSNKIIEDCNSKGYPKPKWESSHG